MSNRLSISEINNSWLYFDDIFVESTQTLINSIHKRFDPSCKVDLCQSNVDTCDLNDSTLLYETYVDQLVFNSIS